jgi:hydrogenase-4 component F
MLGFGSKLVAQTGNMVRMLPRTFVAFFGGFVGISDLPPFGVFVSELLIVLGAFRTGHPVAASLFIAGLVLAAAGFARIVTAMSFGPYQEELLVPEQGLRLAPPFALLFTSALLTVWMPGPLLETIAGAITVLGGQIHG